MRDRRSNRAGISHPTTEHGPEEEWHRGCSCGGHERRETPRRAPRVVPDDSLRRAASGRRRAAAPRTPGLPGRLGGERALGRARRQPRAGRARQSPWRCRLRWTGLPGRSLPAVLQPRAATRRWPPLRGARTRGRSSAADLPIREIAQKFGVAFRRYPKSDARLHGRLGTIEHPPANLSGRGSRTSPRGSGWHRYPRRRCDHRRAG